MYEDTSTANVQAMINVYNYMWVSTKDTLHVIDTSTMKTIVCVALKNSTMRVVQLLHVPEWHTVLVLWEQSEIWCLHDEVTASEVHLIGSLKLNYRAPIVRLCRVHLKRITEVWATRADQEIRVFVQSPSGCCERTILNITGYNCHLITCLNFRTATKYHATHVWVSFDKASKLVCWDGEEKTQLCIVSLKSKKHNL